jgi:hypothetical protein
MITTGAYFDGFMILIGDFMIVGRGVVGRGVIGRGLVGRGVRNKIGFIGIGSEMING